MLGVGAGWNAQSIAPSAFPSRHSRNACTCSRRIRSLCACWVTGRPTSPGAITSSTVRTHTPKPTSVPVSHCSLALRVRAHARIGTLCADEWDAPGITTPTAYRARRECLATYCHEINRNPCEILRRVSTAYLIGHDAKEPALAWGGDAAHPGPGSTRPWCRARCPPAEGWLVGTPDQIISQLQALADEGVERVMFQHNDQMDFAALELLARDVMPAVTTWT